MGSGQSNNSEEEAGGVAQHKLLLLGAGEAGKSTIFKQIKITKIQGGIKKEERIANAREMQNKILETMKKILSRKIEVEAEYKEAAQTVSGCDDKYFTSEPVLALYESLLKGEGGDDGVYNAALKVLDAITLLTKSDAVRSSFEEVKSHSTSVEFLFRGKLCDWNADGKVPEICSVLKYLKTGTGADGKEMEKVPDNDTILNFRNPTSTIDEIEYSPGSNPQARLKFIDVGGQRKERLKWNSINDVTAVIFVAALDSYCKQLTEDASRNRMKEAILLFRMIATKHFSEKPIILLLNKQDLLLKSLQTHPLKKYQKEYSFNGEAGSNEEFEYAKDFITRKFEKAYSNSGTDTDAAGERLAIHHTCATDTAMMEKILLEVEKVVINENLRANDLT